MKILSKLSLQQRMICIVFLPPLTIGALVYMYAIDCRQKAVSATVEKARAICLSTESAREQKQQEWINGIVSHKDVQKLYEQNREKDALSIVPIVSAWQTAMKKGDQAGYQFRVPAESPRNPRNAPTALEAEALRKMRVDGLEDHYVVNEESNSVHYFRPVKISETCLACHGSPDTANALWGTNDGTDITGHVMEDWDVGDVHGAFEVIQSLDAADARARESIKFACIFVGIVLVITGIITRYVLRSVTKPIESSAAAIDGATASLKQSSEELDQSSRSTTEESDAMSTAVSEVSMNANSLASASEQLGTSITEIAGSANHAAGVANNAVTEAKATGEALQRLVKSSDQIGDVISVINGLAEQTNLLALNATIEAARAGESGKGFAVVAHEVKDLANETSKATEGIVKAIKAIQADSNSATESVERIQGIIAEVSESQQSIAAAVEEQSVTTVEISRNINNVASASEAIGRQVESVAGNTQTTAERVQQNRDSVHDIEDMVAELRALLGSVQSESTTLNV